MEIVYSFEQYCPEKKQNITVAQKHTSDGKVKLTCTENGCEHNCKCITRLATLHENTANF